MATNTSQELQYSLTNAGGASGETAICGFREKDSEDKMTLNLVFSGWTGVSQLERKFQAQLEKTCSRAGKVVWGRGDLEVGGESLLTWRLGDR